MADYTILNKGEWQTHLCNCDSESCFLSCVVPCHVYAKIKSKTKSNYCVYLFVYIFLYLSIQQVWYTQKYISKNTCPSILVDNCLTITEKCEDNYILYDNVQYSCVNENGYCISNEYSCIRQNVSKKTSLDLIIYTSLCYFILTFMHYSAREYIKKKQIIQTSIIEDVMAVTCCSTCGLAQEYREL